MNRVLRIALVGTVVLIGLISALIAWAARSDFQMRDCHNLPRAEWGASANCSDGWFAQIAFGCLALGLFLTAALIWRWRARA